MRLRRRRRRPRSHERTKLHELHREPYHAATVSGNQRQPCRQWLPYHSYGVTAPCTRWTRGRFSAPAVATTPAPQQPLVFQDQSATRCATWSARCGNVSARADAAGQVADLIRFIALGVAAYVVDAVAGYAVHRIGTRRTVVRRSIRWRGDRRGGGGCGRCGGRFDTTRLPAETARNEQRLITERSSRTFELTDRLVALAKTRFIAGLAIETLTATTRDVAAIRFGFALRATLLTTLIGGQYLARVVRQTARRQTMAFIPAVSGSGTIRGTYAEQTVWILAAARRS